MITDTIAIHVLRYYAETDRTQIAHTQCVANYTHLIAVGESLPRRQTELLECAAWMHDIGCPAAKEKYGSSKPEYQMKEGRAVAVTFLATFNDLDASEKAWITDVVGTHHQLKSAIELHYEPLFEADLIVNLLEGYYNVAQAETYFKMVHTATGKAIYTQLFLSSKA